MIKITTEITEFEPEKLLTSDAFKYMGGCLFATDDPIGTAKLMYNQLAKDIPRLKNMMKEYYHHFLSELYPAAMVAAE